MAKNVGRNINISDTATLSSAITLNSTTSVKISDSVDISIAPARTVFTVSNPSSKQIWIKFEAASVDNDKKGIAVYPRTVYEMPIDDVYTGEISAIADSGTPDIYVTQY